MARVAEQAERYTDMFAFAKNLIENKKNSKGSLRDFTAEERNLISTSLKNVINSQRSFLKTINSIEKSNPKQMDSALEYYKKRLSKEMLQHCLNALELIRDDILLSIPDDD